MSGEHSAQFVSLIRALQCAQIGLVRASTEGALVFAARGAALLPNYSDDIHTISQLYMRLRYGDLEADGAQQELEERVACFRPARNG